jgi:geranylgeranyl pyrophosphate synthase
MWQKKQTDLLRDEIEAILDTLPRNACLQNLIKEPLMKARRGLSAEIAIDRQPWPLLPLIICEAISGQYNHALPATAALQLLTVAGDVFDDIEDDDSSESLSARYGSAVATNIATTLIILAERAMSRLKIKGVENHIIVRALDTMNSFYTTACVGQHLDLSLSADDTVTEDLYLKIISMKSASQVECACNIGALLASDDQRLIEIFTIFGHNLGMAAQISNDLHGVTRGNDIFNRKVTLPVIYGLTQANDEDRNLLEIVFHKQSESPTDPKISDLLFRVGAMHYTTTKIEFYKQLAMDVLSEITERGVNVERLKLFLE